MARRTKEEAQQTRCNIMSTALDLFCQQGLARTSLTDIAKATDLTRGAIYWHFKNKEELFVTLWEELCAPLSHQLDACVDEAEPDPLGKLRSFLKEVMLKRGHLLIPMAVLLWLQERALRQHRLSTWLRALPPLTELETLLFRTIGAGFALLTATLPNRLGEWMM